MLHDTVKYEAHFKYIVDDVSPKRPTTQTTCRLNASSPKRRVTNRSHIISADPHDTLAWEIALKSIFSGQVVKSSFIIT